MRGVKKQHVFSADEQIVIGRYAYRIWQTIAPDIIDANNGRQPSKATVVEVVMDADCLADVMRRGLENPEFIERVQRAMLYGGRVVDKMVHAGIFGGVR